MSSIKKLAENTMWYGVSSIFARFLNYLLTPYLTTILATATYGEMNMVYSYIPFLNVLFTYGLETAFFRFSNKEDDDKKVFNTISVSILISTIFLSLILFWSKGYFVELLRLEDHPEFISWAIGVIALDTLTTIPFAKLRAENKPRKYAFIRVVGILFNIACVLFFYSLLPKLAQQQPTSVWAKWYNPNLGAGYYIIANLLQSAFTFILLAPQFFSFQFSVDKKLWKKIMLYSLPIMVAGFGGMVNETFDRIMLGWWAPVSSAYEAKVQVGIYAACYKLSILITLFVQAFKMGAEPYFFQQAKGESAPITYAKVMNYFVMTICIMFLVVMLYLDIWKHFIAAKMWTGLQVVPILLVANMCLGVYYNLSIWYKLANKTTAGMSITFIGAAVTLIINFLFIPHFGYLACAWATLACYGSMMILSFLWGQKVYPVPYETKKLITIFGVMLLVYGAQFFIIKGIDSKLIQFTSGTILLLAFIFYLLKTEKQNLSRLPLLKKFL